MESCIKLFKQWLKLWISKLITGKTLYIQNDQIVNIFFYGEKSGFPLSWGCLYLNICSTFLNWWDSTPMLIRLGQCLLFSTTSYFPTCTFFSEVLKGTMQVEKSFLFYFSLNNLWNVHLNLIMILLTKYPSTALQLEFFGFEHNIFLNLCANE